MSAPLELGPEHIAAQLAYSFDYVDELQTFTALSYDHTGAFRAVVADGQIPEMIP